MQDALLYPFRRNITLSAATYEEGNAASVRELRFMFTIHGDIVTPTEVLKNDALVVDDAGKIAEISARSSVVASRSGDIDAQGLLVLPGFLDMHVHGGGGADFMHGTPEAVRQVARTHARFGTTGLLATTLTASREATDSAIQSVCSVCETGPDTDEARILGIHLEGPYICPSRRGAQPLTHIRPPDLEEFLHWINLSFNTVRQITLAPERDGAEFLVRAATERGIVASIGHTDASSDEVLDATRWGARQVTHVFNAMTGIHHRFPGVVGAALASPELVTEVIADGVHLHPLIVRLILAAKTNAAVLITDAMEGAAMPDGEYDLGGRRVVVNDGTASFSDGTLAGSILTMNRAFQNARLFAGLSPVSASRLASANAARQLGILDDFGTLEFGKNADLVILHPESGNVFWTIINGRVAYHR